MIGLGLSILFAIAVIALYVICTVTDYWIVTEVLSVESNYGLWRTCSEALGVSFCREIDGEGVKVYVHVARALMISSSVIAGLVLIFVVFAFLRECTGSRCLSCVGRIGKACRTCSGIIFVFTGLLVAGGTIWYAIEKSKEYDGIVDKNFSFGYSLIIGWVSVPLALIGGCMISCFTRRAAEEDYVKTETRVV
ncbi:claudin-11-like [Ptychodera flava]|uniref:claudin-11-like n=1 Tax=Ptychodera flava TaxID=63121 RepID=UPI00396A05B0